MAGVNIGKIKNSEVSISAEIIGKSISSDLTTLVISVKNEGENTLSNIFVMAKTSNGYTLNTFGELFGTSWRLEKVDKLVPRQKIRFKLGLKSKSFKKSGDLHILISPTYNESDPEAIILKLPLKTEPIK